MDELEGYVELTERISSEKGVDAERFVDSASKLMTEFAEEKQKPKHACI